MGLIRDPARGAEALAHVEHIRQEMLDCMDFFLPNQAERPPVWARVQYADDIQSRHGSRKSGIPMRGGNPDKRKRGSNASSSDQLKFDL